MKVYILNNNGFLLREKVLGESDKNPKKPEQYLIPKGCITIAPPEPKEGFLLWWNGTAWAYIEKKESKNDSFPVEQMGHMTRLRRNIALESCDWTQLADSPLTKEQKAAWKAYRSELRDFTKKEGWERMELPKKPTNQTDI